MSSAQEEPTILSVSVGANGGAAGKPVVPKRPTLLQKRADKVAQFAVMGPDKALYNEEPPKLSGEDFDDVDSFIHDWGRGCRVPVGGLGKQGTSVPTMDDYLEAMYDEECIDFVSLFSRYYHDASDVTVLNRSLSRVRKDMSDPDVEKVTYRMSTLVALMGRYNSFGTPDNHITAWPLPNHEVTIEVPVTVFGDFHLANEYDGKHGVGDQDDFLRRITYAKSRTDDGVSWWDAFPCCGTTLGLVMLSHASRYSSNEERVLWCCAIDDLCHLMARGRFGSYFHKILVPYFRRDACFRLNDLLFLVEWLWHFIGERRSRVVIGEGIFEPWQPRSLGDFNRDEPRAISVVLGQHLSAWNPLYNESGGSKPKYSFPLPGSRSPVIQGNVSRAIAAQAASPPAPSYLVRTAQLLGLAVATLASMALVIGMEVAVRRTINESMGSPTVKWPVWSCRIQSPLFSLVICLLVLFALCSHGICVDTCVVGVFSCCAIFFVSELGVYLGNCFGHVFFFDEKLFRFSSLICVCWCFVGILCVTTNPASIVSVVACRLFSVGLSQLELVSFAHSLSIPAYDPVVTINESGSDFDTALRSISVYVSTTQDETARRLINLLLHMAEIYRHRDVQTTATHVMLFINNEQDLGPAARSNLLGMLDRLRAMTINEALGDADFEVNPVTGQFSQPIVALMSELFGMLSISVLLNKSGLCGDYGAIFNHVSSVLRRDVTVDNFLKRCLELIKTVISAVAQCIKTGSLEPLFSSDPWTLRRWVTVVGTLLNDSRVDATITWFSDVEFVKLREGGMIDPYFERRLHVHEMIRAGHQLLEIGNDLGKRYAGRFETELGLYDSYRRTRALLSSKVYEWENSRVNGAFRVQPFGIYICGKPKTGKTTLSNAIFRNFCTVLGLDFTPDMVQEYVPGANFQDNAGPTKSYLIFDDADQVVLKSGEKNNVYSDVIQLINNKSTNIESARAEDKGKNFARYQASIFATNNMDQAKINSYIHEPIAFWRRFPVRISARARAAYADCEGGLDPSKIQGAPMNALVEYDIEDYEPQPDKTFYKKVKVNVTRYEVMIYLRDKYNTWVKEQLSLVTKLNAVGSVCPVCKINIDDHSAPCPGTSAEVPVVTVNESGVSVQGRTVPPWVFAGAAICCLVLSESWLLISVLFMSVAIFSDPDLGRDAKAYLFALGRAYLVRSFGFFDVVRYRALMAVTGGPVADFELRLQAYESKTLSRLRSMMPSLNSVLIGIAMVSVGAYGVHRQATRTSNEFLFATGVADNQVGSNRFATIRQPPMHANSIDQSLSAAATVSAQDLQNMIRSRLWLMKGPGGIVHAQVICANIILFPAHVFCGNKSVPGRQQVLKPSGSEKFRFTKPGEQTTVHEVMIPMERVYRLPGRDLCLAWVPSIFPVEKDIVKRMPITSMSAATATFDEGWLCGFSGGEFVVKHLDPSNPPAYARLTGHGGLPYFKYGDVTTDGDCGSVGIVRVKNSMFIGFVHVIKCPGLLQSSSYGEELVGNEISAGVAHLKATTGVREVLVDTTQISKEGLKDNLTVNESGWDKRPVKIGPFPEKRSSYVSAVGWNPDCPFEPVGTIQGFHADRFRTGIIPSRVSQFVRPLLYSHGMSTDFAPPDYSGAMVDAPDGVSRWIDPFTHALKSARNGAVDPEIVALCVEDYLFGVEDLLGIDRVRPLTKYEATMGIDGVVKPKDMKRSVGLPFKRQKKHHYVIRENEFDMDLMLCEQSDFFVSKWMAGFIVPPFSNASAKQEVVTLKKLAIKKLRVFQTLGDGYNDGSRRMVSGINAFILAHPQFFECYGTMNITGPELDEYMSRKDQVDPERKRRFAGDYEAFDLRTPSDIKIGTAEVKRRLASLGAFEPEEVEAVYCSTLSSQYSYLIVKGDLVARTNGMNSGDNSTLANNSIDNSLQLRYAYYSHLIKSGVTLEECKLRIRDGDVFRRHVRVGIVGDDNDGAVAESASWYNQLVIRDCLAECGIVYTSASKDKELEEWTPFNEATFLRRCAWFDEECSRWKAALDKNSIARMLLFTKPSESGTSIVDQECDVISTALRESFLHGREFFESMRRGLLHAVTVCGAPFPTVRWYTYDFLQEKFTSGKFEVWANEVVIPEEEALETINESGMDSAIDMGPISEVTTTTGVVRDGQTSAEELTANSVVTEGPLSSFFERAILIGSGSLTSTDVVRTRVAYLPDLMGLLIAEPSVARKLMDFNLLRGDLEITIEVVGNSNLFGMYNASAAPMKSGTLGAGPSFPIVENFNFANSFQGIHGLINVAQSDSVVLTLPYLSEYDYFALDSGVGDPGWALMIHCLDPVTNATDPGLSGTVYYNVYARFRNFELAVPYNEGKKVVKHSVGGKTPGPVSSTIAKVRQVTDIVGMIPGAGAVAAVVGQGLSVAQSIADIFGYTKEQSEGDPGAVRRLGFSNIATTDGVFSGQMVGLSGGNNVTIDPRLGGVGDDDVSFASLFERQTMVASYQWTPLQPRQTCLGSLPVSPGFAISGSGLSGMQPMTCGSLGMPFQAWCGSMEYEVMISCSIYMRGSLQVVWSPDSTPPTTNAIGVASNHILDISVDRSHVFSVKWANPFPSLRMGVFTSTSPAYNLRNGFLHFMVNIPLSSPSAASARILVLGNGGDDLQFSIPRVEIGGKTVREAFIFTNEGQLGDGMVETMATQLAGTRSPVNLAAVLGGEAVGSVRQLMQKFSYIVSLRSSTELGDYSCAKSTYRLPFYPKPPVTGSGVFYNSDHGTGLTSFGFTWAGYYSAFYAGVRGSTRVMGTVNMWPGTNSNNVSAMMTAYAETTATTVSSLTTGFPVGPFSDIMLRSCRGLDTPGAVVAGSSILTEGFSFTFPNYDTVKFRNNYLGGGSSVATNNTRWVTFELMASDPQILTGAARMPGITFYQAFGADVAPIFFIRTWPIEFL